MIDFAIECKRKKLKERESKYRSLGAEVHFRILCSIANPESDVPIEYIQCLWKRIHLLTGLFRIMQTLKSKISTNGYVFWLPSIKFPAVSEFRWFTKVAIKYQARGQCSMADFLQSQSPVDDFSQEYEEVSVDIDLPDTEET